MFVNTCAGKQYAIVQLSMKRDTVADAVVLNVGTALFNNE